MTNATVTISVLATLAFASTATAHADSLQRPSLYVFGGGVGARLPGTEAGYGSALESYGYDVGNGFMMGAYGFAAYRGLRYADVGISAEYTYMHNAEPSGATIAMRTHTRQVGAYVRPRLVITKHIDLGLRLGAGYIFSSTVLRQSALNEASPYTRLQLELMAGGQRSGIQLHIGHVQAHSTSDFKPYAAPDLSGIQFGIGIYYRGRS